MGRERLYARIALLSLPLWAPTWLSGCASPTAPADSPLLQTDSTAYDLVQTENDLHVSIAYAFTNQTGGRVYLVNCNGAFALHLERNEGDEWQTAWSPVLPACLGPPIVIAEDEVWRDTVEVRAGLHGSNLFPQFDVADPSGTYRIVWDNALDSFQDRLPFGTPIPLSERISNVFTLTRR